MEKVFKLAKIVGELAQLSGDFAITGAGFLTQKVSDIALSHINQREKNRLESFYLCYSQENRSKIIRIRGDSQ